jgi:uncharacterized protein
MAARRSPVLTDHLTGVRLARVRRLIRVRDAATPSDGPRVAPMAACYHASIAAGTPFLFGWLRPRTGGPITVLTTSPVTGAGLIYPPGGTGEFLDAGAAADLLAAFPRWARLRIATNTHVSPDAAEDRPALDETLLDAWSEPFAWLLHATPLTAAEIAGALATASDAEAHARGARSAARQADADRWLARVRELAAAESVGAWRLHLVTAGIGEASAVTLAGLVAAATDLTPYGYVLAPGDWHGTLDHLLENPEAATVVGSRVLAALARPPASDVPGVAVVPRSAFAVAAGPPTGLSLGRVLDRSGRPAGELHMSRDALVRHTFVTGITGAGKSTTVQRILTRARADGIPWLVIEPAKSEYAARLGGDITRIRIGAPDQPSVGLNPLRPADGFPVQTHKDMVKAMLVAAFRAEEPFPQILAAAIDACYRAVEDVAPGDGDHWPALSDLRRSADEVITQTGYGREVAANVRGFVAVRLASLTLGTAGTFLSAVHELDLGELLRRHVIIELEEIGDDTDKAFVIGALLLRLVQHLRVHGEPDGRLRHMTVLEEAHRLLRRPANDGPAGYAVETFAAMLAEVRAYGEGLVIADQIPAKLIPDTVKNTATKIVHRLPAADDREVVGAAMGLTTEQSDALVTLQAGTAAVFTDGMHAASLVRVPPAGPDVSLSLRPAPAAAHHVCPSWCPRTPVTVGEQTAGDAFLQRYPLLAVWVDLAVLGHLLALPAPTVGAALTDPLFRLPPRVRELIIHSSTVRSADVRRADIAPHDGVALARHVASDLLAEVGMTPDGGRLVAGSISQTGRSGCAEPRRWCLDAFAWNPIRLELIRTLDRDPDAPPLSSAAVGAVNVPGETALAQRRLVDARCATGEASIPVHRWRSLILGAPPRLADLLHVDPDDTRWDDVLSRTLRDLSTDGKWPAAYLTVAQLNREVP